MEQKARINEYRQIMKEMKNTKPQIGGNKPELGFA
jgi:hypothetical protein